MVPHADGISFFKMSCILGKFGLKFLMPGNKTNPLLYTELSCAMFNCTVMMCFSVVLIRQ